MAKKKPRFTVTGKLPSWKRREVIGPHAGTFIKPLTRKQASAKAKRLPGFNPRLKRLSQTQINRFKRRT